ncbi:MAG: sigma 54-interacting transcriptional regulator [Bacteriovoracaceae bacterium]
MQNSLSELKYYQSFRIPVESKDDLRFLLEIESDGKKIYLEDAKLLDISVTGIGFKTKERLSVGKSLTISLQFKRLHLDITASVVRAFSAGVTEEDIIYGTEVDEEDIGQMRKFIENYIYSFSPERMRDCLVQSALLEKYTNPTEGFEMFSLLLSLFKDMTNFGNREEFIGSMLEEVTRIMNAQRASIFLINPNTNELEAVAALGVEKDLLKFDYRKGIAGSVFTTGLSLNIDAKNDKIRFSEDIDRLTGFITKSILCSPIHNREDKIIGVVEILNKRNEDRFTIEDEKTMKVLGLVFSSVFHNYNPISEKSAIRRFSGPKDREYALIGKSPVAIELRSSVVKLKDVDTPLLITGELGTGKALMAKIIHNEGKRGLNPLENINCGGNDLATLNSELFGHDGQMSKLEKCAGGTVFLREVCHLSLEMQNKLLDVLKNKRIEGSKMAIDIRLISSSSIDLDEMVVEGKFNKEFLDFIGTTALVVPALRKRSMDLPELISYFLSKECKKQGFLLKVFSPQVLEEFTKHDWPGNINELKRSIEKAVLYNPKSHVINSIASTVIPIINKFASGLKMLADIPHANDPEVPLKDRVALIEREMILSEIKRHNGNKSKAAKAMGMSREALRKKLLMSDEIIDGLAKNDEPLKVAA